MIRFVRIYRKIRKHRGTSLLVISVLMMTSLLGNALCFYVFDGALEGADISFEDALWYSTISITTIGYGDYYAETTKARIGTVFFVVFFGFGYILCRRGNGHRLHH